MLEHDSSTISHATADVDRADQILTSAALEFVAELHPGVIAGTSLIRRSSDDREY